MLKGEDFPITTAFLMYIVSYENVALVLNKFRMYPFIYKFAKSREFDQIISYIRLLISVSHPNTPEYNVALTLEISAALKDHAGLGWLAKEEQAVLDARG